MSLEQFEAGLNPGNARFRDAKIQQLGDIDLERLGVALHCGKLAMETVEAFCGLARMIQGGAHDQPKGASLRL